MHELLTVADEQLRRRWTFPQAVGRRAASCTASSATRSRPAAARRRSYRIVPARRATSGTSVGTAFGDDRTRTPPPDFAYRSVLVLAAADVASAYCSRPRDAPRLARHTGNANGAEHPQRGRRNKSRLPRTGSHDADGQTGRRCDFRLPAEFLAASYWTLHESAFHPDPPRQEGRAAGYPGWFGNIAKSFVR